jgi:hypothetical protein
MENRIASPMEDFMKRMVMQALMLAATLVAPLAARAEDGAASSSPENGVVDLDSSTSGQCSYWDRDPYQCSCQPGCTYDDRWSRCVDNGGGGGGGNRACSAYNFDPNLCNNQRNCTYDYNYRQCVDRFGPGPGPQPSSCDRFSYDTELCNRQPNCKYDYLYRACVDRFGPTPGPGPGPGPGPSRPTTRTILCESNDYRLNRCDVYGDVISARLQSQVSRDACVQGRSWGQDNGGLWVDQGCRAYFEVTYYPR